MIRNGTALLHVVVSLSLLPQIYEKAVKVGTSHSFSFSISKKY